MNKFVVFAWLVTRKFTVDLFPFIWSYWFYILVCMLFTTTPCGVICSARKGHYFSYFACTAICDLRWMMRLRWFTSPDFSATVRVAISFLQVLSAKKKKNRDHVTFSLKMELLSSDPRLFYLIVHAWSWMPEESGLTWQKAKCVLHFALFQFIMLFSFPRLSRRDEAVTSTLDSANYYSFY
jgi:hypothetical protein